MVSLSDDVQVDSILVSNLEDFSASFQSLAFYGSIDYPPSEAWTKLGSIEPQRGVRFMQKASQMETPYLNERKEDKTLMRFIKVVMHGG